MKFTKLYLSLLCILLITWCSQWNKQSNITNTDIDIESCNRYFQLIDCIIDNDNDKDYTDNMKEELRQEIKSIQSERNLLSEEEVDYKCKAELEKYIPYEDNLMEIWCSIDSN